MSKTHLSHWRLQAADSIHTDAKILFRAYKHTPYHTIIGFFPALNSKTDK